VRDSVAVIYAASLLYSHCQLLVTLPLKGSNCRKSL